MRPNLDGCRHYTILSSGHPKYWVSLHGGSKELESTIQAPAFAKSSKILWEALLAKGLPQKQTRLDLLSEDLLSSGSSVALIIAITLFLCGSVRGPSLCLETLCPAPLRDEPGFQLQ